LGAEKRVPVYRQTTAPACHTSSKASQTRITAGTAGEWRNPLGEILGACKDKKPRAKERIKNIKDILMFFKSHLIP
jgi:hypothetical protein